MQNQAHRTAGRAQRATASKPRGRKKKTSVTTRLEEILAGELLGVCVAAMRHYGIDSHKALALLSRLESGAGTPVARKLFQDANRLGDLATEWNENSQFLDPSGRPKVLPIRGRGATFEALVRKYFGSGHLTEILEFAVQTHVIERMDRNEVAQLSDCVMLTGNRVLLFARAILSVQWLLSSAENNGVPRTEPSYALPERMACAYIPKDRVAEFSSVMRPHLFNVLDMGNRWLSEHMVRDCPKDIDGHAALVGVHAYVFRE